MEDNLVAPAGVGEAEATKQCKGPCWQEKRITDFHKDTSKKDGLRSFCRSCSSARRRAYWAEHGDKIRARRRERNAQMRDVVRDRNRDRNRRYDSAHREERRVRDRKRWAANRHEYNARARQKYAKHRTAMLKAKAISYRANIARLRLSLDWRLHRLLGNKRSVARRKNLPFDLDKNWLVERPGYKQGRCESTALLFDLQPSSGRVNPLAPSFDQTQANVGYLKENTRIICDALNIGMNCWGEAIYIVTLLAHLRKIGCILAQPVRAAAIGESGLKAEAPYYADCELYSRLRRILSGIKSRAKRQGLPFGLDLKWMIEQFQASAGRCVLTDLPFELNSNRPRKNGPHPRMLQVDRIYRAAGYLKANCRLVCAAMNSGMNEWGEEVYRQVGIAYLRQQGWTVTLPATLAA